MPAHRELAILLAVDRWQAPGAHLESPSHPRSDSIAARRPGSPPVGPEFRSLASGWQVVHLPLHLPLPPPTGPGARPLNPDRPEEPSDSSFLLLGVSVRGDHRG